MISLTEIILHLRQQCPSFERRVGGTNAFGEAMAQTSADLPVPHCFVIPMFNEAIGSEFLDPENNDDIKVQGIRELFATIICVDNSAERSPGGKGIMSLTAVDQLRVIEEELKTAFMGWRPVQQFRPVRFSRGAHIALDNKRLWHQFEWSVSYEDNPATAAATEAQIRAIINGSTAEAGEAGVPVSETLQTIYVRYGAVDGFQDTLMDFWPRAVGNPGSVPKTPEEIAQAQQSATTVIQVDPTPSPEPTGKQVGNAATKAPIPEMGPKPMSTKEV
jgi:hypothetical protein